MSECRVNTWYLRDDTTLSETHYRIIIIRPMFKARTESTPILRMLYLS